MAGFLAHLILTSLLLRLAVTAASGTLKELTGAVGGSVNFPLDFTELHDNTVIWTFNTFSLVIIQPPTEGKQTNVIVTQNSNQERINFPNGGHSLKLGQLKKNDSGIYRVEIIRKDSQSPFTQEYKLHVYEYLSEPKVTMSLLDSNNGTCTANLTCSVEQGGEKVIYSWKTTGQAATESFSGSTLPVSWKLGEKNMSFICMAQNPISNSSSSPVLAWKLCGDTANASETFKIIPYVSIIFALGLIVLLLVWITRTKKRKVPDATGDMKTTGIQQEIPDFHPHDRESAQYETFGKTNSEKDQEATLYSIVQIPKMVKSPHSQSMSDTPRPLNMENII